MTQRESIFSSSVRAFCAAFFGVLGVCVGAVLIVILLGAAAFSGKKELEVAGNYRILPSADGQRKPLGRHSPLILHLNVVGLIGTEELNATTIREQLERSRQGSLDGRIRAVFLKINSPGGSAFASDAIFRLIDDYRQELKVPVYAYVDGLCASGGMYAASAADKIYASPVSLIGSVGVLANFINISATLEKLGMQTLTLTRGKDKDPLNPLRPWKEGEDKEMLKIMNYLYERFVNVVVAARPQLTREDLIERFGARIFPSPTAQENGYIDGVVNSQADALTLLVKDLGLEEEKYQVIELQTKSWLEQLISGKRAISLGPIRHRLEMPEELAPRLMNGFLFLYRPED